jgi:hypothetical protein
VDNITYGLTCYYEQKVIVFIVSQVAFYCNYNSMADVWKHGMDKYGIGIQAVAATVKWAMDLNSSLSLLMIDATCQCSNNITPV